MRILRTAVWAAGCAAVAVSMIAHVAAQNNARASQDAEPLRNLVYIGTPGDNGTDNQSGVVVLDADKNYIFVKRIPYGLPASKMPGPKVAGITASVPLNMIYVAVNGWMKAIDLATDEVVWTFNGESSPVQRPDGWRGPRAWSAAAASARGCCRTARR